MKGPLAAVTLVFGIFGAGSSLASSRCDVPLAEWQPREVLQQKLEAEGWKITRIKTDDGCYKVRAINDKGERYEGKFHPGTLKALKVEIERE